MGNEGSSSGASDPNEKRSRFMCTSNKQDRKHNKNKVRKSKYHTLLLKFIQIAVFQPVFDMW